MKCVGPRGVWVRAPVSPQKEDELQRPAALSRKQRVPPGIGIDTYFFREYMESNLIWRLGPPAKRVAPARVWGSIPLFSATGKLSPMATGSAWKARRAARHTVRFRSFPQTKSVCRIQYKQWRGVRVAEGARLESVCRSKAYRGFESVSLRIRSIPAERWVFFLTIFVI